MFSTRRLSFLAALAALCFGTAIQTDASQADQVQAHDGWLRLMPAGLPAGGYLRLDNGGDQSVQLEAVDSPRYRMVMLHQSRTQGGISRMQMLSRLALPAHGEVRFVPGGYHLMLSEPIGAIQVGDAVPVRLHFADGSSLGMQLIAKPANANIDDGR